MSNNYPRVRWPHSPVPQESFAADEFGNSKVVPADAIVIERSALPPVKTVPSRTYAECNGGWGDYGLTPDDTPERLMEHARALISLAEYLREHPPVDEREVKALHRLIGSEADASNGELARRLLATGKVHVDVEDGVL